MRPDQKSRDNAGLHSKALDGDNPNDGIFESKAHMGQTILRAYGKDSSNVVGSAENEREGRLTGGSGDLSHSFSGNQVAKAPDRGSKPKL